MRDLNEKILIIEDEDNLARFIELELMHEGYGTEKARTGRQGLEKFESDKFSLVLLDIMLPELSGLEVLRRIRRISNCPVILLTARDAVTDKVGGLDGGADDYVTKPFSIEELLARIRVCLRKNLSSHIENIPNYNVGKLSLNLNSHIARYHEEELELTKREFDLLKTLMENEGIVLSRKILLNTVWGYDYMGETNVVDVYIGYLRNKVDERFGVKFIHTIRSVGYVLRNPEN